MMMMMIAPNGGRSVIDFYRDFGLARCGQRSMMVTIIIIVMQTLMNHVRTPGRVGIKCR